MELLILLALILIIAWFILKVIVVYVIASLVLLGVLSVKEKLDL